MTAVSPKFKMQADKDQNVTQLATETGRETLLNNVKLSAESVDGLYPNQIKMMRQTVVDVNEALNVAGVAVRQAMEDLVHLKANTPRGNWGAFIKSGVLNISPKAASDLVNAYEKWIGTDEGKNVKDYVLQAMTPRTLSAVANAPTEVRNEIQSKVISGSRVTEAEVRKLVGSTKKQTKEQKALRAALKDIGDESKKLVSKASNVDEAKLELKDAVIEYEKVVSIQKRFLNLFKELKETPMVNTKSELIMCYEEHLAEQNSKNILSAEMIAFMMALKGFQSSDEYKAMINAE